MKIKIRSGYGALLLLIIAHSALTQEPSAQRPQPVLLSQAKEKVLGIGGFFFRAKDPNALAAWYHDHLGIDLTPTSYDVQPWTQEAGPTVFAPFAEKTEYFGEKKNQWMINFRVRDLDAMVRQLREDGIEVTVDPETYPNGRFARLDDPEGHPLQLWEARDPSP